MQVLGSSISRSRLKLDPRTKLVLLLVVSTVIVTGGGGEVMPWVKLLLMVVPPLLFIADGRLKGAFAYVALIVFFALASTYLIPYTEGFFNLLFSMFYVIVSRIMPSIMMGWYFISTTSVSEFVCAMEKMHVPQSVIIPISVVFRFFPTVIEEFGFINDAMRMRGVKFGGSKVGSLVEYRIIPMMMCSLKIGEELSASALTRGLGAPIKRTNICIVGFGAVDIIALLFSSAVLLVYVLNKLGIV